jgi:UbiD family decarboxylase
MRFFVGLCRRTRWFVDDDVNVLNDSDVLWAMGTRMQADDDISIIRNAMGAILDPSNKSLSIGHEI